MNTKAPILTDRSALTRNRARASDAFLQGVASDELKDRLEMVNRSFTAPAIITGHADDWTIGWQGAKFVQDSNTIDLTPQSHDLVIHGMALHWADDPVGQIIQARRALKPDGLFLGAFLGGQTLNEMRSCLSQAETEITGGLSPRVAPMTDVRDAGALLQRAGLTLPVADTLPLRVSYANLTALMHDLRKMGETNALAARLRHPTRRAIFDRASALYDEHFSEDGRIIATFEIILLTGWAPDESQPQPLRPGSATTRLADALGTRENPLKD